jgi:stress response protein SCP2
MEINEMIYAGVNIPVGEYEGPFLINRPAVCNGGGASFYIREIETAALNVDSSGVTLKNLSVFGAAFDSPALLIRDDTVLEDISVYGTVIGKETEEGFFNIPYSLSVGSVCPDEPFEFSIKVSVPHECELVCDSGVTLSADRLSVGENTLGISLPAGRAGSIIRRSVYIKTGVTRRMVFTAALDQNAEKKSYAPLLFEPDTPTVLAHMPAAAVNSGYGKENPPPVKAPAIPQEETAKPQKVVAVDNRKKGIGSGITQLLPKPAESGVTKLSRGMHYPLSSEDILEIEFFCETPADVDAYVFMHDGSMVIKDSRNLVFFGNDTALDGSVSYLHTNIRRAVFIDLKKISAKASEIDLVYAAYDNTEIFGKAIIKTRTETLEIDISGSQAVTVFELNIKPPAITLTPLIMPYRKGIAELIRSYGLEVY